MRDDIKQEIENQLIGGNGKVNSAVLRRDWFKESQLCHDILRLTSFLDFKNPKFTERIWCVMNDITSHPKCGVCEGNAVFLPNAGRGYSKTCSSKSCKTKLSADKAIETKIKKYGAKVSPKTREKAKERATELNRKMRGTVRELYGVENISQIPGSRDKARKTLERNHNVSHPSQVPANKKKNKQKTIKLYQGLAPENITVLDYEPREAAADRVIFSCSKCNESHSIPNGTFKWRCQHTETPCITCLPLKEESNHQHEISTFIMEVVPGREIIINDTSILPGRRELDIYIPSLQLAIEYDGVYWHSYDRVESREEKNLHLWKTEKCEEKGIHLVHIFENEWVNTPEIVKSRLSSLLGSNQRIFARKCKVISVESDVAKRLLGEWHLQGPCASSVNYGLVFGGEIVSLMTFGRARFSRYQWELLRFASKPYFNVVGGANKLFSHFLREKNPDNVISYANRRWSYSQGTIYEKLGFDFIDSTTPGYFYFRKQEGMVLQNRIGYQKHKLPDKLDIFDPNLTESQNMFANDFRRIWDCGNLVFVWGE